MPNLFPFLSYVFVVTFTPGPNNIMSMVNANKFGFRRTRGFLLGVFAGFSIVMILSSYFNLILFNLIPKIKVFMGILGAAYMIYLAFKIVTGKDHAEDNPKYNSFPAGVALQFVNPKGILYGITVVSNFILPYSRSDLFLVSSSIALGAVAYLSVSSWALFGAFFQRFLSKHRKPFNVAMGILLVYSAVSISGLVRFF